MENTLYQKHLVSVSDLSVDEISLIFQLARQFKQQPGPANSLRGKILASCFYEPSTRTRLSFEAAALRLAGQVIGFSDSTTISANKGECLYDSIQMICQYADIIVLRHPKDGAARLAAEFSSVPVINAGDGANRHPTQTLLDLFSIHECQGRLDGLHIALVGDLKYGRTAHSLAQCAARYNMRLYFVSPENFTMPNTICETLRRAGVMYSFHRDIAEIKNKVDVIYMTRLQKERLAPGEMIQSWDKCAINASKLSHTKPNLKILHPLPRTTELAYDLDQTPQAYYFEQAKNGLFVRQAILALLLNPSCEAKLS